ncbi:hypothetical protein KDW_43530 [Dictyobacter vulcani]|uniref:Carrier domain-containing protein n=2 Tax=Dictyobacter vulcani TaxID=2607529 RepID=A0A5J4KUK0_9CHLR|nr:hypothetical protein KDW_43530 [Dictyobacter vulcani]
MQGAWSLLLSHYSAQDDIVFGVTLSGRSADVQGVESMVGLFINTLPVRIQIRPEMAFEDWLQEIQEQQSELRQYEYTPLVQVQGWSELAHGVALFDTLFVFENYPISGSAMQNVQASLQLEAVNSQEQTHYPLTLYIIPGERMTLKLLYDGQRFDSVVIEQMLQHLQNLLKGLAEQPSQAVGSLPLLGDSEQRKLLVEWNNTQAPYPADLCLHQLFEQQVERTPEALAVIFEQDKLTYRALDQKANQLACYLRSLGVGPEVPVGVSVEPCSELLIGILAILKAGGVYVPLDPAYPAARLAYMLNDSALDIILTQKHLTAHLPVQPRHVVELDSIWEQIAQLPDGRIQSGVTPDNLAYIIYTSGSTGKPKGVLANHRASVNRFNWMWQAYPFTAQEQCCQKTALNFVDSIWELLGPVLQGVPLTIFSKDVRQDPVLMVSALAASECTRIVLVPSLLRAILTSVPDVQKRLPKLKLWVCSGEILSLELAQLFKERCPQGRLLNLYGSSEVTADVTYYATDHLSQDMLAVPIGVPIANMHVYILDHHQRLAPMGVPGELCVGGIGLARGYLNQPDMTAAAFIPDPFAGIPGARLYRTGDLARYLADGTLEYLGRVDQQIKIRGFRIEPGEIENALRQHTAVQDSLVLAQADQSGEASLVAYIVTADQDEQLFSQLRESLQQQLPAYMLPAAFVRLAAWPLLPGGKVNRHALTVLDTEQAYITSTYLAPRTPMEELLVEIWADVLRREREQIGVQDNFFEIGGHSLLATQVISRIRMTFQVDLPVRSMFEAPSVETMIVAIAREQVEHTDDDELARLLAELDEEDEEEDE